jgi:hypothetical protein
MVQTNGYVGINTTEPRSYLHINGPNNTPFSGAGYRRWMQTGVFNLENSDNLFTGLMPIGFNRSDAVWVWGDDSSGEPTNYSRFIFTGAAGVDGTCTSCPLDPTGRDGREVMRLAPNGNVGVGPLFETNGIQSNIHNHMEGTLPIWFQQSNRNGTGGLATDGLRMGIDNVGRAYLKNQENQPLIFSTDNNTTSEITQERVRITHVNNAETPNPFIFPQDLTRIGISLASNNAVNRPLSLIHMGTNVVGTGLSAEGWRFWMNNGIYMREQSDNIYVGTKREGDNQDRADAIVAWGDNMSEESESNLRFVFATSSGTDPVSQSIDGREVGRFSPLGNLGIGNFYTNGLNQQPTQRVDVDGTARLRQVPASTLVNNPHVLITGRMQDVSPTTGDYVLNHLAFNGSQTSFLAGDGTWQNGTNVCDWFISGQNLTTGHSGACLTGDVGIGRAIPAAKLDVFVGTPNPLIGGGAGVVTIKGVNSADGPINFGVIGISAQLPAVATVLTNKGGSFIGANANSSGSNYGVEAIANESYEWAYSNASYGVHSMAARANRVYGVYTRARFGVSQNVGVYALATNPATTAVNIGVEAIAYGTGGLENFGVKGFAQGGLTNYGVYGDALGNLSYAVYANGNSVYTGGSFWVSDASLKTNVEDYSQGLNDLMQLKPKTYDFLNEDFPNINLPETEQFGLIAQEVAEVLPNLTKTVVVPSKTDSLGNEIFPATEVLGVNYIALVPILISAVQEQQTIIESQNEALAQVMEQLASMQEQINQCCNADDGTRSMPGGTFQPQDLNNEKSSEGGNELYQNIPNPFRESTTISYQLEFGGRVQLSIYDGNGKLVTTLVDTNQPNGRHSAVWNANGMPSGVYHYALYVDGELLVKRAIKLQE